jgi:two-component system phosphate regulon sensor histidine kinase PhoR
VAVTVAMIVEYTGMSKRLYEETKHESDLRQNRLLTTMNAVNEAIVGIDSSGNIRVYNSAAMILFDTNVNLHGKKLAEFLKVVDENGKAFDLWQYIKKEGRSFVREDLSLVFSGADKINLSLSCAPIFDKYRLGGHGGVVNRSAGYVLMLKDITKSKTLEEERDEFISVVSHELRTPVAVAEGAISNVQYLVEQKISATDLATQLSVAHDQVIYLSQMINDIGTLSRAQRGVGADLEEINLVELAENMRMQYAAQVKAKGLKMAVEVEPGVGAAYSSRLYLQEILQNFITNAIKYTKKGTVTLAISKVEGGAKIAVSDTGIGISKSDQKRVFEKFFRSEDFRTRETNGTGLGLYVVKKLAAILEVTIKVESELNKGSTFSFVVSTEKPVAVETKSDGEGAAAVGTETV